MYYLWTGGAKISAMSVVKELGFFGLYKETIISWTVGLFFRFGQKIRLFGLMVVKVSLACILMYGWVLYHF